MTIDLELLPLVLAGPSVRRVGTRGAHVWIALRKPRRVELSVYHRATGAMCASGTALTVALGQHLHVTVVEARGGLAWGQRYLYDLTFARPGDTNDTDDTDDTDDGPVGGLLAPGVITASADPSEARAAAISALTYPGGAMPLPGFCLPPADLEQLRIAHGSCRMPHAEGSDALTALDTMLGDSATDRQQPPHLLLLHGDQIYADNVAPSLLATLTELGDALLGWTTALPGVKRHAADLAPGRRAFVLRNHVASPEPGGANHVLSLGEFYAAYLTTMSDTCWRPPVAHTEQHARLRRFHGTLPLVRRALANIATYAMFDDHEVTDDWNLTRDWAERVLAKPMGRRLVANALGAYAVFFAWGNTPERFASDTPGRRVLDALSSWRTEPACTPSASLLGIPDAASIRRHTPPQLAAPPGALDWHYRIDGPQFEIIVIDGRTCRAFPGQFGTDPPALLSSAAIDKQLAPHAPSVPLTIIVSSSVLLPVPRPWYVRTAQWVSYGVSWLRKGLPRDFMATYGPDRGDKWGMHTPAFDYLLGRIADRAPAPDGTSRVICLCGDVHVAYAARLRYVSKSPARTMVLAHLTASGLQRESSQSRTQQRLGYGVSSPRPTASRTAPNWRYDVEYLTASDGIAILGRNHLAELRITWNKHAKRARHILWWQRGPDSDFAPNTTFAVALDADATPRPPGRKPR